MLHNVCVNLIRATEEGGKGGVGREEKWRGRWRGGKEERRNGGKGEGERDRERGGGREIDKWTDR